MSDGNSGALAPGKPVDPIPWFTNPLDWRPIDRIVLLGLLVMLAPALCGLGMGLIILLAPEYLHLEVVWPLMALYAVHLLLMAGFLIAAGRRRQVVDDWPAFEGFVIGSFVFTVFTTGFLTGTHFAEALLLTFLGILIVSTLGNVRRLIVAFYVGNIALAAFAVSDALHLLPPAPALARPLVEPDGSVVAGMVGIRIALAAIVLAIARLAIGAIARWVERENLYREMSTIDGLTRLSNRRSFLERGESELSRARRFGDNPVACIMVDLDHFKKINDSYGHHAGDQVLVAASAILMNGRRQYDEVGRYGGEEFAILLPNTTVSDARRVAERIRIEIAGAPVVVDNHRILMTASLGVAAYPSKEINCLNDLLKAADRALYAAKESGRNRVCVEGEGDTAAPGKPRSEVAQP